MMEDLLTLDLMFQQIKTWDTENIKGVSGAIKTRPTWAKAVSERYDALIKYGLGGSKLSSLANLPQKWQKMNAEKRALLVQYYPKEEVFFTDEIDLSGHLRVDAWRDSHYKYQIGELPKKIGQLKNTRILRLQHQQLKELPHSIGDLEQLEELDLTDNNLNALPASVAKWQKLRKLNLTQNYGFTQVLDFSAWQQLEEIDFTYTDIKELPDSFFVLPNLRKITTVNSDLDRDTAIIRRIKKAFPNAELITNAQEALDIEEKSDENEYKGKEKIRIDEFNLNYLPPALFAADVVKELEIKCYHLKVLPDLFDQLPTLEKLYLRLGNDITSLPDSVCRLANLKELELEHSQINELPAHFGDLSQLKTLKLNGKMSRLPDSFARLSNLEELALDCSWLVDFVPQIAPLSQLKSLKIENLGKPEDNFCPIHAPLHSLTCLETLKIKTRGYWTDEMTAFLPQNLQKFELQYNIWRVEIHPLSFSAFCNHLPQLQKLDITAKVDFSGDTTPIEPHENLKSLFLHYTQMPHFPATFVNLKNLKEFTAFSIGLKDFGAVIYGCTELEYLRIHSTDFTSLPDGIEAWQKMSYFGFETHKISQLPEGIFRLANLKKLCLAGASTAFKTKLKKQIKGVRIVKNWYD
jgi:Leucine-rich repeat (LRR) protein